MKITRRFTKQGQDALSAVEYEKRTSRITNPDGSVVFEMHDAEIPRQWSQLATDIMVSKYFRKAGVPQTDPATGEPIRDTQGNVVTGPEKSAKQVVNRLAGCWRYWGEKHGYFDSAEDAQAFYDELAYMLLHQMCAPNSPQWFNTGLNWAYGITGPAQGHYYNDPRTGETLLSKDAYTRSQPHACFIQSIRDDLVGQGGIMDLWTREARLFKYGSGTGSNFSDLRGENEPLSGGGKSSGLMSFLRIGDRAAGAIKSGGTTRRAAKMVCLNLDHPDIEQFVNWKVREELKVAAMAEGIKHIRKEDQQLSKKLKLKLDYDFNGEAYYTVSGQNSNNSVRIPNRFFNAVEEDGNWNLTWRTKPGAIAKTLKARDLWDQIAFAAWRCADPGVQYDDTINQWHTCPRSGRINASNPCVTGDTRVLTPGGIWRRIDQMIHLPSRVITNLDAQEIHGTDGAFPTGTQEVFELQTVGGYKLKLTADHKVYTRQRGWVDARALTSADEIKLPSQPACVQEIGEPQDARFFHLLGLFLSGANNDPHALHLDRCLDPRSADSYASYVAETWMQTNYDDDYVDENMIDIHAAASLQDGDTLTLSLTNRRLLSRLGAFIRTEPGRRQLSDEAFTSGLAAQKHLLRALFTADGILRNNSIELNTANLNLLEDLQLLLLGFGVKSSIAPFEGAYILRIEPASICAFAKHIGLLPGHKLETLAHTVSIILNAEPRTLTSENFDAVASLTPLGKRQVFDLTEPATSSFIANGITVHNCSEYMFLDDTACNLASLNVLTFFDPESRRFDVEGYKHAIRLWTIVLEISVLMASFPSEAIARLSYRYRTLGLGYANLGAMLMQAGIPYDSDKGRALCAALTAILTGESYATSADLAREHGAFPGYADNRPDMLRVIRNHRRAAHGIAENKAQGAALGEYEALDIHPVPIDHTQFSPNDPLASAHLLSASTETWDRALALGERFGFRNAQTTVIAPTGTIGLLMDCDTTGVEPDFALVKFKKLAGGGYFKIANQSLEPSLRNLGYDNTQIHDILTYVLGTLSLDNSPHINRTTLRRAGLTDGEIDAMESALPSVFELSFALSPYSLNKDTLARLGIPESEWQAPNFNLLQRLGFSRQQINEANDAIVGRGTVEGAPHLKDEHLPVFDCANKCGKIGRRFIPVEGHIRMMAAAQPFISGAISKTINLPNEATVEDIKSSYFLSWQLGLKANALYRDGSKLSQPLNVKSDEDLDKSEEDDEENVKAAREELARDAITGVVASATAAFPSKSDNLIAAPQAPIEKIIERIVERPLRRRLPDTRNAKTHKFDVQGHEGYITVGLYDDGSPGEVFITMAKEGSTIGGLMDTIATLVSVALQYGVPVESLVRKFEHVRFEPSGMTRNPEIPIAKSIVDYIFRWLAMEFIPGYRAANAPQRKVGAGHAPPSSPSAVSSSNAGAGQAPPSSQDPSKVAAPVAPAPHVAPAGEAVAPLPGQVPTNRPSPTQFPSPGAPSLPSLGPSPVPSPGTPGEGQGEGLQSQSPLHAALQSLTDPTDLHHSRKSAAGNGNGNGNGHPHTDPAPSPATTHLEIHPKLDLAASTVRLVVATDPLSQQGTEMQADAPACDVCGSITVRSGTCYKCLNCGNSMGCS